MQNSGDTTPEIQVHPHSSETMGDGGNKNTTILHTKINPPPPKPPDRTYQSIAGAYGRTRDNQPWQTTPDSIDTRAATRAGLTQYNPTVVATGKETEPPGGQGEPESIKDDQPGLELKRMMDQFQKLQLELDENRSRMATMKKEHEAEIIRANRAYTESLKQPAVFSCRFRCLACGLGMKRQEWRSLRLYLILTFLGLNYNFQGIA